MRFPSHVCGDCSCRPCRELFSVIGTFGCRLGYLMGVPVGSYSLDLGRAHTDFIETKLQRWVLPLCVNTRRHAVKDPVA